MKSIRKESRSIRGIIDELYSLLYADNQNELAGDVYQLLQKFNNDNSCNKDVSDTRAFYYLLQDMGTMSNNSKLGDKIETQY